MAILFCVTINTWAWDGAGTSGLPYRIATVNDLRELAVSGARTGTYFELMNDIDLSGFDNGDGKGWMPIRGFNGSFDGNNHKIKNLDIDRPTVGLFNAVGHDAIVKNLGVEITAKGFVNASGGFAAINYGAITNCYVTGSITGSSGIGGFVLENRGTITNCYVTGSITGSSSIGGLVFTNYGTITNCHAKVEIICNRNNYSNNILGGLVGHNNNGTITNCYATGQINNSPDRFYANDCTGGLVGINYNGTITNCHATGAIYSLGSNAGGLVGHNSGGRIFIENCYSTSRITGVSGNYVGGLIGRNGTDSDDNLSISIKNCYAIGDMINDSGRYIGGLVGRNTVYNNGSLSIENCYATGKIMDRSGMVRSGYNIGGFTGDNSVYQKNTFTACFFDTETTGQTKAIGGDVGSVIGVNGVNSAGMKMKAAFSDWDFISTWDIIEGVSYPYLRGVTGSSSQPIVVTGVTINPSTLQLNIGGYATLSAIITPDNATNKTVTWSSSNQAVASVSDNGVVTANAAGSAIIIATTADGNKVATCAVTVTDSPLQPIAVTGVTINNSNIKLNIGGFTTLLATVTPDNATNKAVTWLSSNPVVASVSDNGTVTAHAAGSAIILVTTVDGNFTSVCNITVTSQESTTANETVSEQSLIAYPNPTNGVVTIDGLTQGTILRLYDKVGVLVTTIIASEEKMTIDLSHLQSGMYFMNCKNKTLKIVVL